MLTPPRNTAPQGPEIPASAVGEFRRLVADPDSAFERHGGLGVFFDDLDHYIIECPDVATRVRISAGMAEVNGALGTESVAVEVAGEFDMDGRLFTVMHWNRPRGIEKSREEVARIVLAMARKLA